MKLRYAKLYNYGNMVAEIKTMSLFINCYLFRMIIKNILYVTKIFFIFRIVMKTNDKCLVENFYKNKIPS